MPRDDDFPMINLDDLGFEDSDLDKVGKQDKDETPPVKEPPKDPQPEEVEDPKDTPEDKDVYVDDKPVVDEDEEDPEETPTEDQSDEDPEGEDEGDEEDSDIDMDDVDKILQELQLTVEEQGQDAEEAKKKAEKTGDPEDKKKAEEENKQYEELKSKYEKLEEALGDKIDALETTEVELRQKERLTSFIEDNPQLRALLAYYSKMGSDASYKTKVGGILKTMLNDTLGIDVDKLAEQKRTSDKEALGDDPTGDATKAPDKGKGGGFEDMLFDIGKQ